MISTADMVKLSNNYGIDSFTLLREYVQISFLDKLFGFSNAKNLVFKGGTALRFFLNSPRFSEDLDFSATLNDKEITDLVNKTASSLKKLIGEIKVKDIESIVGTTKKLYFQTELSKQPLTIKLDFSKKNDCLKTKIGIIKTNLPIITTVPISFMDPEEILAEKTRAILTRKKGRDLYDIWFLINQGYKLNLEFIKEKLNLYNEKYEPKKVLTVIKNWDDKKLFDDINKFLSKKDRLVIPHLKELAYDEFRKTI
jgi:predicted nucleotidyltransferase component of viral defense system